jgi:AcrR family transcriptional regulator
VTTKRVGKKSEETKRKILHAALELFREKGFEQTTMRDIAEKAGMALGAAYYYFDSKEKLVLAYYQATLKEVQDFVNQPEFNKIRNFKTRMEMLLDFKFRQMKPYRAFLGVLSNPDSIVSPFSDETQDVRDANIALFDYVIEGSDAGIPSDLRGQLPRLLWYYQMSLILFWLHDRSRGQTRTKELQARSLDLLVNLIRIGKLPFMKSLRKSVLDLVNI